MDTTNRSNLNFEGKVRRAFIFLDALGFSEIEALPTLVRYRKGRVEVDIYHGHQSYEIGAGITVCGIRYAISEIIRVTAPEIAKQFRYAMTTTPEGVTASLGELSSLMKSYGDEALRGNSQFFSMLEKQRKQWSNEYALDVLAEQLRPQANEAFRRKNYSIAADLYSRIRERLSPAEIKKLCLAENRRNY
ncbi:MAG: hypothetical protein KAI83_17555 [Thiomargarita sp.]|nr:hypothetical protein [Thiomargarita sp.]